MTFSSGGFVMATFLIHSFRQFLLRVRVLDGDDGGAVAHGTVVRFVLSLLLHQCVFIRPHEFD